MDMQISIHDALVMMLAIAGLVAIIVLIVVLIKLFKTLKKVDYVVDDVKVVTGSVSNKVEKVDSMVDDGIDALNSVIKELKGNNGLIKTATSVFKAVTNVFTFLKPSSNNENNLDK